MSYDLELIEETAGETARREFEDSPEWAQEKLALWIVGLPGLSDVELQDEAGMAIHTSALVQSFRGNWEHEHCKASAVMHEVSAASGGFGA